MKKLLITGGSGFLGRNLALSLKDEYEVVLASRNNKQNIQAKHLTGVEVMPMDVSNMESVRDVFRNVKPNIVIHAAATKFVDLAEKYPLETVDINILGSQNVARAAMDFGVEFVLGISTDKAAPPVKNIYGLSKATMEKMFCLLNSGSSTKFACVRYGNVAWSTGSVLPIWKKMHQDTGTIKTTGPHMRRFFFTVDQAVELVKTALDQQDLVAGKILSRSMKSVQISDLLDHWVEISGGSWELEGERPGERLDEFLIGESEVQYTESLKIENTEYYLIDPNQKAANPISFAISSSNAERLSTEEIKRLLSADPENK